MTSFAEKMARPEILELTPYSSGYDDAALENGIRLNANENPWRVGGDGFGDFNRYPPSQPEKLIARLSEIYGVGANNVLVSRGADEAIDLLVRAFCRPNQDAIAIAPPTFGSYATAARLQCARIIEAPLTSDYTFDTKAFVVAVKAEKDLKIAFICSPMSPTGGAISKDELASMCEQLSEIIVAIDEAYIEFSALESMADKLSKLENLVILRTLSKAYGLAGARCGAVLASPDIIAVLQKTIAPYPMTTTSIDIAMRALSPVNKLIVDRNIRKVVEERERVAKALNGSHFVARILPSETNFLFIETNDAPLLKKRLDESAIRVRWLKSRQGDAIRLTIGAPDENDLALAAFGVASERGRSRIGECFRETKETNISVAIDLESADPTAINTGIGYFDHMLEQVARHGGFSLLLTCDGDLEVDTHHTIEDCMLAFGAALRDALGDGRGMARFGAALPMDEARAEVLVDLSGRPFSKFSGDFHAPLLGEYPTEMTSHAFRSLSEALRASIHVSVDGGNDHHKTESCFKALGRALRQATRIESNIIPSTKGVL
ncbi:MAG: histidinol-phosphate transaminase [Marinicaulis sp.]|nr:histidinol-phosphate transaminase [Marinicaulis sp.]